MKRLLPIILLFFLFNSCFDQNDCLITSTNLVSIDLATRGGVSMSIRFNIVKQDSVTVGTKRDSTIEFSVWEGPTLSSLQLPLDPQHDTSYFVFETSDSAVYKLAVKYTTYSRVISTDCGAFLYYKDLAVINDSTNCPKKGPRAARSCYTTFDSTRVIESQLFKSVPTNIKLFF